MRARINVFGRKLEGVSINYREGAISDVLTVDDNGKYSSYRDESEAYQLESYLYVDLKKPLEFQDVKEEIEKV